MVWNDEDYKEVGMNQIGTDWELVRQVGNCKWKSTGEEIGIGKVGIVIQ